MKDHSIITVWSCCLRGDAHPTYVEVLESRRGLLPECATEKKSAVDTRSRNLLIMFPGNPGVVNFYRSFVQHLSNHSFDVLVMGFAGHSLHELNDERHFVLQDQLEVAEQFCRTVLQPGTTSRYLTCCVGGHSIGGFVALHMTSRFRAIHRAFLLTPTICNMRDSPNGQSKRALLKRPIILGICATALPLLHCLPEWVKEQLVKIAQDNLEEDHRHIAKRMTRPNMIRNLLMLARSEFEQVATLDVPLLQSVQERLVFYFVKKDGWVPLSDVNLIRSHVPKAASVILEDDEAVAHAWCLNHNQEVIERGILPFVNTA